MKFAFSILFLVSFQFSNAQEYPFDFIITFQHPDSINFETDKKDFDAFIELSESSYAPLFHLKGTTLPTPFSPVYEWDLFVGNREFIEINVTNEIGQNMVKTFQDTLNPGIYNIKLDGLWDIEKPTCYLVEVKSRNKTSILKSFFGGLDNLLPPEDGLTIKAIPSNGILNDSLSITSTIAKNKPHHLTGWILNLPKRRQVTFQLHQLPDSTWHHYETLHLKPGLYEITINPTILNGKYFLNIQTHYGNIKEEFYFIHY